MGRDAYKILFQNIRVDALSRKAELQNNKKPLEVMLHKN